MAYKALPIGVDDFKKLRKQDYYYVDKTELIKELLEKRGEINLFTRPRRFGKTLALSMIKYFFEEDHGRENEIVDNSGLFHGLAIEKEQTIIETYQGKCPVIFLTLKAAKQPTFELAYAALRNVIAREYLRHMWILDQLHVESVKEKFCRIMSEKGSMEEYNTSLQFLCDCLHEVTGKSTILLIDEYDVPLENAYFAGFYKEMIDFTRSLFESALKTNLHLDFAVITGCLRITKESIFTGLNNLKIITILSDTYSEYFGFTEKETKDMLKFYKRTQCLDTVKRWYDGYLFGRSEVYNPWSVINYVDAAVDNPDYLPRPYWANTSSNSIVKTLVEQADGVIKAEIETLVNGGSIEKPVHEDITYGDVGRIEDNLWNFLFFTGYLKAVSSRLENDTIYVTFSIPNTEVRYIYKNMILDWFRDRVKVKDLSVLYTGLTRGDATVVQSEIRKLLIDNISMFDTGESFYHGFLIGILANMKGYIVTSNREAGDGRYDVLISSQEVEKAPMLLEFKIAKTYREMDKKAAEAMAQIESRHYEADLYDQGYDEVICYGIAFYRKQCLVIAKKKTLKPGLQ